MQGLIIRMSSFEENIRLAALTAFKHILNSSHEHFQDRMPDIFKASSARLQHVLRPSGLLFLVAGQTI